MEIDLALSFVATHHHAILSTTRRDNSPQMSPVAVGVGEGGRLLVSSRERAIKTLNVRRQPAVSLCVLSDGFFGEWRQIDGTAEVVSLPDAMEGLIAYYRSVSGEHPDWEEYRVAMLREERVLLVVTPHRAGPDRSG
jgi:PPOX class probable F420-dependent enzyme